jgi:heme A synthase
MKEIVLLGHVLFGVSCLLATVWLFVDVLNAHEGNLARVRWLSRAAAVFFWLGFLAGGYWYVVDYKADKEVILKGPWPFAHNYFMETKEHFVITLLLLATYLPIAASNNLALNKEARRLVLCVAALVAVLALMAEGHGAIISMGVKVALLAKPH